MLKYLFSFILFIGVGLDAKTLLFYDEGGILKVDLSVKKAKPMDYAGLLEPEDRPLSLSAYHGKTYVHVATPSGTQKMIILDEAGLRRVDLETPLACFCVSDEQVPRVHAVTIQNRYVVMNRKFTNCVDQRFDTFVMPPTHITFYCGKAYFSAGGTTSSATPLAADRKSQKPLARFDSFCGKQELQPRLSGSNGMMVHGVVGEKTVKAKLGLTQPPLEIKLPKPLQGLSVTNQGIYVMYGNTLYFHSVSQMESVFEEDQPERPSKRETRTYLMFNTKPQKLFTRKGILGFVVMES